MLIHGAGVVRAGQWARRLIINEDLEKGTQIPFIKWAKENDFGVIVTNTNDNWEPQQEKSVNDEKKRKVQNRIKGSENPEEHARTVWEQLVLNEKDIKVFFYSFLEHTFLL